MTRANLAASVRARLLNRARADRQNFDLVLTRYALERLLYRISISEYRDTFLLKGALLFDLWFDIPHRPTRDIDLLGFGSSDVSHLAAVFKEICAIVVEDGIVFHTDSVRAGEIRKDANYGGVRVTLMGSLDGAKCPVQVDIGFGDAVTPEPESSTYPILLEDFEAPELRTYPIYTVVAEKYHALSTLGIANSRMKDYFDLWVLSQYSGFDGAILSEAVKKTFERRNTLVPAPIPFGLTPEFSEDQKKKTQWEAFCRKNRLEVLPLPDIVKRLVPFLTPVSASVYEEKGFTGRWQPGGPWSYVGK